MQSPPFGGSRELFASSMNNRFSAADCIRILSDLEEGVVSGLLEALESSPRLVEDIVFFTGYFHCPLTLEAIRAKAASLAAAFPEIRAAGYRVGINHLCTMGHIDENLEIAVDPSLPRITGIHGEICRGTLCPNDPRMHDYVRETYTILASTRPDIIWVDDDVRINGHMPAVGGCFCDACVAEFSCEVGESFTRESLLAALDDPDEARRVLLRRRFITRNGRVLTNLLSLIRETIHGVDPGIELGMMSGELFWEGSPFADWTRALQATCWRPGGGFYDDSRPGNMIEKAHSIGRQISAMPPEVTVVHSEIENFPYQSLNKAARSNVVETTAYLFAGCTGAAYNILNPEGNPISDNAWMLRHLKAAVPFWNVLKAELAGSVPVGVWGAWEPNQIAAGVPREGGMFFGDDMMRNMHQPYALSELGIPLCYGAEHGAIAALSGRMPLALGAERVTTLLAKGALLDAEAARSLADMGLADLCGVECGEGYDSDTREIFTDHAINGDAANWKRDCRQSFRGWNVRAYGLRPLRPEVAVLARISDYQGRDRGVSVSAFTNELGGRVAVTSYFPWTLNLGRGRRQQLVSLCDWLSQEKLPIRLDTVARITPWVRRHPDGRLVIGLLNLTSDTFDAVDVLVRGLGRACRVLTMDGAINPLATSKEGKGQRVTLRDFEPFSFQVILAT
jgi:hypothetical protein